MVVNRWHDNVNSQFSEESTLKPEYDTIDFIDFSIGSYPNSFAVVKYQELPDFLRLLKRFKGDEEDIKKANKYFIGRSDERFWDTFDWFQENFNKAEPIESGLYDLNRYYHK